MPILSCGGDKQSFTVVLAVKADGEKLPPKVIFKGVRQLRIEVPRRMQVSVHKKTWMDEEGLLFFLYHALDGTEDDAVWDDEEEEAEDAEEPIDNEFETDREGEDDE